LIVEDWGPSVVPACPLVVVRRHVPLVAPEVPALHGPRRPDVRRGQAAGDGGKASQRRGTAASILGGEEKAEWKRDDGA